MQFCPKPTWSLKGLFLSAQPIEAKGPFLGATHIHIECKVEVATQKDRSLPDDPKEIALHLVEENGIGRARQIAVEGTTSANEQGDFYRLSVWREVKRILREWT